MSSNIDYYFKNPDTVEPYKIDKDKISTAISLIETTRLDQFNKDEKIKMRFANEQIQEIANNSELGYFKSENSIAKVNVFTDSKSELIPIQETEKTPIKKKIKKGKVKSNDNLVITSLDLDGSQINNNNLTINENDDVEKLYQKPAEKKKIKKKVKKNTEPLTNENGEVVEVNDDLKSETGSVTLKKKFKKKNSAKTAANDTINTEDGKPEKKIKKTKKKDETKTPKDQVEALNLDLSGDGENKLNKKMSDAEPN
jgi:hypothetical protein